jgi:hypothetical protein
VTAERSRGEGHPARQHGAVASAKGRGPLLQRDYWAVIRNCRLRPSEFGELLATRFWELPPPDLVRFRRADGSRRPLAPGDDLEVDIRFAGRFGVRVTHKTPNSLTLGTLPGHPEAGRITFGAYRHDTGGVIFHIRSIARSSTATRRAQFLALGGSMQAHTWSEFIARVAASCGQGVADYIYEETARRSEEDQDAPGRPTFIAQGD